MKSWKMRGTSDPYMGKPNPIIDDFSMRTVVSFPVTCSIDYAFARNPCVVNSSAIRSLAHQVLPVPEK